MNRNIESIEEDLSLYLFKLANLKELNLEDNLLT